jgi:hypothetical protein
MALLKQAGVDAPRRTPAVFGPEDLYIANVFGTVSVYGEMESMAPLPLDTADRPIVSAIRLLSTIRAERDYSVRARAG